MKTINKYTEAQKKGLYCMLKDSKNMTPSEKKVYSQLRIYFAEQSINEVGADILIIDGYVKEVNQDTFGEDYRFGWCKIKETNKGIYYYSSYNQKRIYL